MKRIKVFTITTLLFIVTFSYSQKFGPTPEDSIECIKNLSLYREYFKQWRRKGYTGETIKDIVPHWRYCFIKCPKATENIYINGVKIFSHLLKGP